MRLKKPAILFGVSETEKKKTTSSLMVKGQDCVLSKTERGRRPVVVESMRDQNSLRLA